MFQILFWLPSFNISPTIGWKIIIALVQLLSKKGGKKNILVGLPWLETIAGIEEEYLLKPERICRDKKAKGIYRYKKIGCKTPQWRIQFCFSHSSHSCLTLESLLWCWNRRKWPAKKLCDSHSSQDKWEVGSSRLELDFDHLCDSSSMVVLIFWAPKMVSYFLFHPSRLCYVI